MASRIELRGRYSHRTLTFDSALLSSSKLRPATAPLRRGSLSSDHGGGKRRGASCLRCLFLRPQLHSPSLASSFFGSAFIFGVNGTAKVAPVHDLCGSAHFFHLSN